MIQNDFEKFFKSLSRKGKNLDFEIFGEYASSILNFYVGSALLTPQEKEAGANLLTQLFNAGLGNVISLSDLNEISNVIVQDPTLDYSLIQPVFDL